MKKLFLLAASLISLLSIEYPAFSVEQKGPHGGQIVSHKGEKFEIKLDQESKQLDVYAPPREQSKIVRPDQIGVVLYKNDKSGQTIRLKTVEPPQTGGSAHYQGEISPSNAPYVAFGIEMELSPTPDSAKATDKQSEDK